MNYLTTLLNLCVDDKTAQTATKLEREHRASQKRVSQNRVRTGLARELINSDTRTKKKHEQANSVTRVFNTGSQGDTKNKNMGSINSDWRAARARRRDKNHLPVSSTCCHLNTDHKDVALLHEFEPHLHTPKNLLKQIQRCFSLSSDACFSAFLMSQ